MALVQYIYTSVLITEVTAQNAYDTAVMSSRVCQQFGISGRAFANRQKALAITEGEEEVLDHHFRSVEKDPLTANILLHVKRPIVEREFSNFSVWLNIKQPFQSPERVYALNEQSLTQAWPEKLSAKVRIMADAYLDPEMLAA